MRTTRTAAGCPAPSCRGVSPPRKLARRRANGMVGMMVSFWPGEATLSGAKRRQVWDSLPVYPTRPHGLHAWVAVSLSASDGAAPAQLDRREGGCAQRGRDCLRREAHGPVGGREVRRSCSQDAWRVARALDEAQATGNRPPRRPQLACATPARPRGSFTSSFRSAPDSRRRQMMPAFPSGLAVAFHRPTPGVRQRNCGGGCCCRYAPLHCMRECECTSRLLFR